MKRNVLYPITRNGEETRLSACLVIFFLSNTEVYEPISPPLALPKILVLQGYRISPGRVTALGYPEDAMRSKIDHLFAPQQAYKTSE